MYSTVMLLVAKTGQGRSATAGNFGDMIYMGIVTSCGDIIPVQRSSHLYFFISSSSHDMFRTLPLLRTARAALRQTAPIALRPQPLAFSLKPLAARGYAAAAGLSKDDITVRILDVLKSFEKVDSSKVRGYAFSDRFWQAAKEEWRDLW